MSYGDPTSNQGYPDPTDYDDNSSFSEKSSSSSSYTDGKFYKLVYYFSGLVMVIAIFCTVFFTSYSLVIPIAIFIGGIFFIGGWFESGPCIGSPTFYWVIIIVSIIIIIGGNLLRWKLNF